MASTAFQPATAATAAPPSLTSEPRRVTLDSVMPVTVAAERERLLRAAVCVAIAAALAAGGCGGSSESTLPHGSEAVSLDAADFTTQIDNPYWPMKVGSRWIYRETDAEGAKRRVVVTVTPQTKTIDRHRGAGRPRPRHGGRRRRRGHARLVRAGRGREPLVSRRGHEGVRERQAEDDGGLVGGRRRRCAAGHHRPRAS